MDSSENKLEAGDTEASEIPEEDEIIAEIEDINLSPNEHQRIKDLVNGTRMDRIKGHTRRYLIAGAGGETGAATRRKTWNADIHAASTIITESVAIRGDSSSTKTENVNRWNKDSVATAAHMDR